MTYENYIKGKLVQFAVREAYHYGGWDCMAAVAQVIANRVQAGWGEWSQVIDAAPDFVGTLTEPPLKIDPRSLAFRKMLMLVDDIYHGVADDSNINITDDRGELTSLYYCNLNELNRPWFQEHILDDLRAHPRIATVGPLSFFA
jgi:hypothetical protein